MAPSKGMLAGFFSGSLGPHHGQTHPICPGRNHFAPMVFDVVGRNIRMVIGTSKKYANPSQLPVYQPCISQRGDSQTWSDWSHRRLF